MDLPEGPYTRLQPLPTTVHGQSWWHSSTLSSVNSRETLLCVLLKILKGYYIHLPAAGTEIRWETHLCLRRSWKGTILGSSPSSHGQGPVQPTQGPGRRHTLEDSCLENQVYRPQPWLWNLKQPQGSVLAPRIGPGELNSAWWLQLTILYYILERCYKSKS